VSKARDADGVLMPYHLVHGHVVDAADASQRSSSHFTSPFVGFASFNMNTTLARSCALGSSSCPWPSSGEA
jgi:hypothetical protein